MINKFYENNITFVDVKKMNFRLSPESKSFFIGSCFATNIYNKFSDLYLKSTNSPFGNIYNPKSLGDSLTRVIESKLITREECIQVDGIYQHFSFHSKLGNNNLDEYLEIANNSITKANKNLLEAELLIITLGTAYVFEKETMIVNNCHKLPKKEFIRRVLTLDEIKESLITPLKRLKELNTKMNIVITLSPVRHLRDDATENSLSKALLRVAIDEIRKEVEIYYFPSYEILLDELRDYRWYDKSLNHPSDQAVEYITSKFIDANSGEELKEYIERVGKLKQMLNHKIINNKSDSSVKFIEKRDRVLDQMKKKYPHIKSSLSL